MMHKTILSSPSAPLAFLFLLAAACSASSDDSDSPATSLEGGSEADTGTVSETSEGGDGDQGSDSSTDADTGDGGDGDGDGEGGDGDGDGDGDACAAPLDEGKPLPCELQAQPGSFAPVLQWEWEGDLENGNTFVISTPLVGNFTDDNDDGSIDLCDTPDVIVSAFSPETFTNIDLIYGSSAKLYVLDGADGSLHFSIDDPITWFAIPALADIDGDGEPEIIAPQTISGNLMAWKTDGTRVEGFDDSWVEPGEPVTPTLEVGSPIAVHNLDEDGLPEILMGKWIFDASGQFLAELDVGPQVPYRALVVADLDEDGINEIVAGHRAWSYTGSGMLTAYFDAAVTAGQPQVADLTGDGHPEVLITSSEGVSVLDYQGNVLIAEFKPSSEPTGALAWERPATVHDFDGDGQAEFAFSIADTYMVLEMVDDGGWTLQTLAQWPVLDASGLAAGTAFDFLGDGDAEAMYADEDVLYVWESSDDQLEPYVAEGRTSRTIVEYPVVADVDNDNSAEIVVVSNENPSGGVTSPPVQVYGDMNNRWIPARRIWNQHAYVITNVREDGTIPADPRHSWKTFNSFRTNSQIENNLGCIP